jgi:hypothetical protein
MLLIWFEVLEFNIYRSDFSYFISPLTDGLWNFMKARDCARIMGKYLDEKENDELFETARCNATSGLSPGMRDTGRLWNSSVSSTSKPSASSDHQRMGLGAFSGEGKGKEKYNIGSEDGGSGRNGRKIVSCSRSNRSSSGAYSNDSSSNDDRNRGMNGCENAIEAECDMERKDDSTGMEVSHPSDSTSNPSISGNYSLNPTRDNLEINNSHRKKEKEKEKEKKMKVIIKNKKRSARVDWSNKNIENLNYLFTLDSHVPTEALNYFNGFLPLVTATANVVVSTTDVENSDIENIHVKSTKCLSDIISNIATAANTKKEVKQINKNPNKEVCESASKNNTKSNKIVMNSPPSSNKSYSFINPTPRDNYTKSNEDGWESVSNVDYSVDGDRSHFSVLKVACDIGTNHREGAFVSHCIVRKECSPSPEEPSSPDRILQIQAKACAGLESKLLKTDDAPGTGVNLRNFGDRKFDPGYFERKNKERRVKRTSYPSILKDKIESEERADSFSGDFLFEYYESQAAESSTSRCAGMKISINEGPALTLILAAKN